MGLEFIAVMLRTGCELLPLIIAMVTAPLAVDRRKFKHNIIVRKSEKRNSGLKI